MSVIFLYSLPQTLVHIHQNKTARRKIPAHKSDHTGTIGQNNHSVHEETLPGDKTVYNAAIYQLDNTQWLPPEALRGQRFRQLNQLLHHALATTDFYRQRLGNLGFTPQTAVTPDFFQTIPLLLPSGDKKIDIPARYC
ncbi:MAG: hypothetical protein ACLFPD_04295 [Desulfosudaceae bacterium]